jgi:hypothetical protein
MSILNLVLIKNCSIMKKMKEEKKIFTKEDLSRIMGGGASASTSLRAKAEDMASARTGASQAAVSDNLN